MTAHPLHVRVGRIVSPLSDTHPLVAALYTGDAQVGQAVHFRDMRQVRSYYNGLVSGMTLTGAVRYGETVSLPHISAWPYRNVDCIVPVNVEYLLEDGIDPMHD